METKEPVPAAGGGGAGIEVPEGSSLNLKGSGVLNATGGNAGNGLDGGTTPNGFSNSVGGAGGGGAGAGIGGKGGTHDLNPHAGSITIDDKSLLVYANGGKGGQGGAGADGGDARRVGEVKQSNGFYMLASYNDAEVVYEGGAGGGGGGGGGYPAAGIGSGGAAGKRGAAGGQGGRDDAYAIIVITALVVYIPETWCAAGGGGGWYYSRAIARDTADCKAKNRTFREPLLIAGGSEPADGSQNRMSKATEKPQKSS